MMVRIVYTANKAKLDTTIIIIRHLKKPNVLIALKVAMKSIVATNTYNITNKNSKSIATSHLLFNSSNLLYFFIKEITKFPYIPLFLLLFIVYVNNFSFILNFLRCWLFFYCFLFNSFCLLNRAL